MAANAIESVVRGRWITQGLSASKMSATLFGGTVMSNNDAVILLVDDDRVDIMTVQRTLKKIDVSNPLYVAW